MENQVKEDEKYMRRCLQLARNGLLTARPNPMVGAVIVSDKGRIIGEGYHIRPGEGHAEVNAFASVRAKDESLLAQSTVYVSFEPCSHYGKTPPCADLIVQKGVRRVVCGCVDPFAKVQGRGIKRIREAGIEVTVGVLERECLQLNRRFITVNTKHRPYVILKWAQTSNGFIDDNLRPIALSTPFTRMLVHKLRAESDAILVGRITDEREHPCLDVRDWWGQNPLRLVLDHRLSLSELMADLYARGVQSLLVEGGAATHRSFIEAELWDEIRVETVSFTVQTGTKAPAIPGEAQLESRQIFSNFEVDKLASKRVNEGGSKLMEANIIDVYRHR